MKTLICLLFPFICPAQPNANAVDWPTQVKRPPALDARTYQFTRTNGVSATGNLSVVGSKTVTLTPCPAGVSGTNANHYVYISGGTGTAEAVLITGGSCTSGAASGTITFTTSNTHTGAWNIVSASGGIVEAIAALPSTGGQVTLPFGTVNLYQTLVVGNATATAQSTKNSIYLLGRGSGSGNDITIPNTGGTTLLWAGPSGGTVVKIMGPIGDVMLADLIIKGAGTAAIGLDIVHSYRSNYKRVAIQDWTSVGLRSMAVDFNFPSMVQGNNSNVFESVHVRSVSGGSGAVAGQFGQAVPNVNTIFDFASNLFLNSTFRHDDGVGVQLRFADANTFMMSNVTGGVASVQFVPPGNGFPVTNVFYNCHLIGQVGANPDYDAVTKNMFFPLGEETLQDTDSLIRFAAGFTQRGRMFGFFNNFPLNYQSTTTSTAIVSTSAETAFDRSFEIPANALNKDGTVVRVRAAGRYSNAGTPTLTLRSRIGGTGVDGNLYSAMVVTTPSGATNFGWTFEGSFVVRTSGASANVNSGPGMGSLGASAGGLTAQATTTAANFTLDTTAAQELFLTAQWGTASGSNTIVVDAMSVEILYPGSVQ